MELLYTADQGGGGIVYSRTRRLGYCIQLNKEIWGIANLGGSSFYREQSLGCKYLGEKAMVDIFCTCHQHPHRDQKKALPPSGPYGGGGQSFAIFPWVRGCGDMDVPMFPCQQTFIQILSTLTHGFCILSTEPSPAQQHHLG